jgi:imidazolonepropionase-like amidohydrolase
MKIVTLLPIALLLVMFWRAPEPLASEEIPAKPQDHPIALVGANIHTVSGPVIEGGTLLFDKGKIVEIGTNVGLPQGTEIIDVQGKHLYPGMINARSSLGLIEIGLVRATRDLYETGSINPNIRSEVAINPESEHIPVTRANGITLALIMPGSGIIGGMAAVIALDGWTWEDLTFKAPAGLIVNWPSTVADLSNAFRDARAYLKAKRSETGGDIPYHDIDTRWESMAPVLDGKIPVLMNAEEVRQIQAAVAWAEQERVKLVIVGGYDSWRVMDLLKAKGIPVIACPIHRLPWRRWEAYDTPYTLPKKLYEAGVPFCIAGEAGVYNTERNLPYHAAMAASFGLPKEEALKAVTLYPAQILGMNDRVGSLEVGKDATVIVTNGDPLEIITHVEREFIQGKKIPLTSKHTRLYEKYREKYRRLERK